MKRNTISNIKSIIVFSTIIILLSLISVRTEASELHNAKLDNATINRVTPENMEEYNIILKGIENEKYLINYYIERLETTPEVCEWFYVTYGSVDKIQDCILKY